MIFSWKTLLFSRIGLQRHSVLVFTRSLGLFSAERHLSQLHCLAPLFCACFTFFSCFQLRILSTSLKHLEKLKILKFPPLQCLLNGPPLRSGGPPKLLQSYTVCSLPWEKKMIITVIKVLRADGRLVNMSGVFCANNFVRLLVSVTLEKREGACALFVQKTPDITVIYCLK